VVVNYGRNAEVQEQRTETLNHLQERINRVKQARADYIEMAQVELGTKAEPSPDGSIHSIDRASA
jgi:hypothetical protein